jgi:phosphopantothenate-cysteine ligase
MEVRTIAQEFGAAGQPTFYSKSAEQLPRATSSADPAITLSFNIADCRPSSPSTSSVFSTYSETTMFSSSSRSDVARQTTAVTVEHDYFSENPPPKALEEYSALAKVFINYHSSAHRRVVLITSGGTTVPLERQTVRFIDNFSAGTRGATSAEYFLEAGYAVIFLHRQFSLLPYSRHYSHATDCFLDFLHEGPDGSVVANEEYREKMLMVLRKYNAAKSKNLLLTLPFTTITDYLFVLRSISQLMRPLGPNGLLYLAAAVSDFFVPPQRMVEHKIQSTDATNSVAHFEAKQDKIDPEEIEDEEAFDNFDSSPQVPRSKRLVIDLDPVPKFLKNLVDGWAPEGMIISFKLETDPEILIHKAQYSLERYQHHLVIGNLLATRKWEVVFVSKDEDRRGGIKESWIRVPRHRRKYTISGLEHMVGAAGRNSDSEKPSDTSSLPEVGPEMEIESLIIPAVEEIHTRHIERSKGRKGF